MDDMLVKNSTVLYFSLLALGVFVCGLLSFLSLRSQKDLAPKAGRLTLVEIAFAACFAFVGAVLGGFLMLFSYIRATGIGRFFTALNPEQLSFLCGGAGAALAPALIRLFGVCVLRVAWILVVLPIYHTLDIVLYSYPITWILTSILFIIYYLKGPWLEKGRKRLGHDMEETA